MASDLELKKIKKMYGERFMHMCRELFPTILEEEGALLSILENTFATNSKTLYEDIHDNQLEGDFKDFICKIFDPNNSKEEEIIQEKTPYELLDEAGYDLYECKTEKDIQKFKKYYLPSEELCTFKDRRLDRCIVFFAVKKNVDEIKRENFNAPKREDEYGTSVVSIQFYKTGTCTVSIKNRYNHTVNNPDATYGNNLDRIISGLSQSFEKLLGERGLEFNKNNIEKFFLPRYVVADDGRYYKYNLEINGMYYCPENIVVDRGEVISIGSPEKKILIENFIVDLVNKKITQYDKFYKDSFLDGLQDIEKIEIVRDKESRNEVRIINIKRKNREGKISIRIDEDNQIIGYENEEITEIEDNFLHYNEKLVQLSLPNVVRINRWALGANIALTDLSLPNLMYVGSAFLLDNEILSQLELPKLRGTANSFLYSNLGLKSLKLPYLEYVDHDFLHMNEEISEVELPNLKRVGDNFLVYNKKLIQLKLPQLQDVGYCFLLCNKSLQLVELPNLEKTGELFLVKSKIYIKTLDYRAYGRLDKKSKLTTSEIIHAQLLIKGLKKFLRKIFNR